MSLFRLVYASTSLLSDEPDLAREQIEQILTPYHAVTTRPPRSPERFSSAIPIFPRCSKVLAPRSSASTKPLTTHPRHKDLLLLLSEPLAARQFPDWSMAYIGPNQWAKQAAGPPSLEPAGARRLLP